MNASLDSGAKSAPDTSGAAGFLVPSGSRLFSLRPDHATAPVAPPAAPGHGSPFDRVPATRAVADDSHPLAVDRRLAARLARVIPTHR